MGLLEKIYPAILMQKYAPIFDDIIYIEAVIQAIPPEEGEWALSKRLQFDSDEEWRKELGFPIVQYTPKKSS